MHDSGQERERQQSLTGYGVLDTPNELQFDAIVKDAARILGTPIALISLVDEHRQWSCQFNADASRQVGAGLLRASLS